MKQTIIVTGGAGFIGHHLIKRLLNDGEHVMCVDNLSTGSYANIKTFTENPNKEAICCDLGCRRVGSLHSDRTSC